MFSVNIFLLLFHQLVHQHPTLCLCLNYSQQLHCTTNHMRTCYAHTNKLHTYNLQNIRSYHKWHYTKPHRFLLIHYTCATILQSHGHTAKPGKTINHPALSIPHCVGWSAYDMHYELLMNYKVFPWQLICRSEELRVWFTMFTSCRCQQHTHMHPIYNQSHIALPQTYSTRHSYETHIIF